MKSTQNSEYPPTVSPGTTRREFITRASYATPVLISLPAIPAFAQTGSAGTVGGGGDPGPMDCMAQWDGFLTANGYPTLQDLTDAIEAQGGQATDEQRRIFDELTDAFGDGICEIS